LVLLLISDPKNLDGIWASENAMSLGELWLELFRFYALDFDIVGRVVCIQQFNPLLRSSNAKRWMGKRIAIRGVFFIFIVMKFHSQLSSRICVGPTQFHVQ
jgi:hypothetical protein